MLQGRQPGPRRLSPAAVVALLPLALVLSGCSLTGGATDTCLLQQYQTHSADLLSHLDQTRRSASWLAQDAHIVIAPPSGSLPLSALPADGNDDLLATLRDDRTTVEAVLLSVQNGPLYEEEGRFRGDMAAAGRALRDGMAVLAAAYIAARHGEPRTVIAIAEAARTELNRAAFLIGRAGVDLAAVKTASPNC